MAKESKGLLSGGLFAKPIMNSRVKTRAGVQKRKVFRTLVRSARTYFRCQYHCRAC